jgi:membrane associated rhomboid family serine protease
MSDFKFTRPNNFPPIVKNLIIINVIVYVAQLMLEKDFQLTSKIGLWPVESPHFQPYQFFTHMFAHDPGNIFHIIFNMFNLWMFGKILENVWGAKRFLIFYLACGIGAAVLHLAVSYFEYRSVLDAANQLIAQGELERAQEYFFSKAPGPAVGASGAVMGIFVAFGYLFPNTELMIMPIPIPIKAKWLMIGLVAIDLFGGVYKIKGDSIAHFAHLGGAITGFILVFYWNKTNRKTLY